MHAGSRPPVLEEGSNLGGRAFLPLKKLDSDREEAKWKTHNNIQNSIHCIYINDILNAL